MAVYGSIDELKNAITDTIYQNNAGLVTADILQERILDVIDTLDAISTSIVGAKDYLENNNDLEKIIIGINKAATEGWVEAKNYITAESMPWATPTTIGGIIWYDQHFEKVNNTFRIKSGIITPASHDLLSSHTITDQTAGCFLKALTSSTFGFVAHGLTYSDVGACSTSDSRLSDARIASDVYAWAKASNKPSYSYSEVGALASGGTAVDSDKLDGQHGSYYQTILTFTSSGDRWGITASVDGSGVMEIGKYIDFHETDADISDYAARITCASGDLTFTSNITCGRLQATYGGFGMYTSPNNCHLAQNAWYDGSWKSYGSDDIYGGAVLFQTCGDSDGNGSALRIFVDTDISTPNEVLSFVKIFDILMDGSIDGNLVVHGNITATGEISAFTGTAPSNWWDSIPHTAVGVWGAISLDDNANHFLNGDGEWVTVSGSGGGMVYPNAGIPLSTGSAWETSITNNSANWNTAYTDRMKWDGGATGLVAATGRSSLELGTAALAATGDFVAYRTFGSAANNNTGDFCLTNDSRLSDSRIASDVYSWAKASSKPSYTYSEVGALASGGTAANSSLLENHNAAYFQVAGSYEPANSNIQSHISSTSNPHSITATQVSLGNVTNESKATMFTNPTFTGVVTMPSSVIIPDGGIIGLGTNKGLIQFDDETTDTISFLNCDLGIGISLPERTLDIQKASANLRVKSTTSTNPVYVEVYNNDPFYFGRNGSGGSELLTGPGAYGGVLASSGVAPFSFGVNGTAVITMYNGGNVAIGNFIGAERLHVTGNILATGEVTAYYSSDERLKYNIDSFSALNIIKNIYPITFNWNNKAKQLSSTKDNRKNYGIIAQDLELILPELIHPIYEEYKAIDYIQLVPILIQAIKELNEEIRQLTNG